MAYRMGPEAGMQPESIAGTQSEAPPAKAPVEARDEALDEDAREHFDQLLFNLRQNAPRLCEYVDSVEQSLSGGNGLNPGLDKHIVPTPLPNDLHPYLCSSQHLRLLEDKFTNVYDCERDPEELFKHDYYQHTTSDPPDLPEGVDTLDKPDESIGQTNTTNNQVQSAPAQVPPEVRIIPSTPIFGATEETGNNKVNQEEPLPVVGPTALEISKGAAECLLTFISGAREECLRDEPGGARSGRCLLQVQEDILRTAIKDCIDDENEDHHRRLDVALKLGSTRLHEHASRDCRSATKQGSPLKVQFKTGTSHDVSSEQGPPGHGPSTLSKTQQKKEQKKMQWKEQKKQQKKMKRVQKDD